MSFSCGHRELQEPHWAQYQMTSDLSSSTRRLFVARERHVDYATRVVLLEVLGRRAHRGAHAAEACRQGVAGDQVVLEPPCARLSAASSYQASHSVLSGLPPEP